MAESESLMRTILKYPLTPQMFQEIELPEGAIILHVAAQHSQPCLWAEVDDQAPKALRLIVTRRTGDPIEDDGLGAHRYVGSYQIDDASISAEAMAKHVRRLKEDVDAGDIRPLELGRIVGHVYEVEGEGGGP